MFGLPTIWAFFMVTGLGVRRKPRATAEKSENNKEAGETP